MSSSAGEYQPLVEHSAAAAATRIVPSEVVPFKVQRPVGIQACVFCVLALLVWLIPTLDPFGKVEAATKVQKQKKEIEVIRKVVKTREEELKSVVQVAEDRESKISEKMQELMGALRKMKPAEKSRIRRYCRTTGNL